MWMQNACFKLIISKSINFKSITNSNRGYTAEAAAAAPPHTEWHFTFDIYEFTVYGIVFAVLRAMLRTVQCVLCAILTQFKYNTDTDMVEMSIQWFIFCAFFNLLVLFLIQCLHPAVHHSLQNYLRIRMQMDVSKLKVSKHFDVVNQLNWVPNMGWISRKTQTKFVKWSQNILHKQFGWFGATWYK